MTIPARSIIAVLILGAQSLVSLPAQLRVATTHPLIGDLARQVGGERVAVIDILRPGQDLHHFEPAASDLRALAGVALVLASGKNLESYLPKLRDSLGPGVRIVEVGRSIPSLKVTPGDAVFLCCPEHMAGGIDPHWWHSPSNMARAAGVVAKAFTEADPPNAAAYKANGVAAAKRIQALKAWAKEQISVIPRSKRKLVTSHAAFGYFCREFGFQFIPVMGLAQEEDYSPKFVAEAIRIIREDKIIGIFPEDQTNPKILREISRQSGVAVAKPLIADGTNPGAGSTFEGMLRHNVATIVETLAKP
ncbi:MAG TPA: metal ABC transporter substrate-binding protein [Verrucomicrobiales bacterium]|nr:metal ABC transporter substrate-binding protein [Verrucomicrobiales bacterium]